MTGRAVDAAGRARMPLSAVRLCGRRRRIHDVLHALAAACALVALVTVFLPWHEVRDTDFGFALGCAFVPDCHAGPAPTAEEMMRRPPDAVHSGLDHGGAALLALLAVLVAIEVASLLRPRFWFGLASGAAGLVGLVLLVYASFDLRHLFDHVTVLAGERVHDSAMGGFAVFALAQLVVHPILYRGARRAARSGEAPAFPAARVVE